MARTRGLIRVLCAALAVSAMPLRAAGTDEATETFNALYGTDLKRVRETGDARDDVELAARLLAAAKKATDQPLFLTVLCEKACDLAVSHPTGYGTALAAMDLLARTVPDKAAACAARTFEIREMQYQTAQGDEKRVAGELLLNALLPVIEAKEKAGDLAEAAALYRKAKTIAAATGSPRADEIESRAARLAWRMKLERRVRDVKALLERDPKNVSAREGLVRLLVIECDDPAEAGKVLDGCEDKDLLKYVPAAAKPVEAAPEFACLELGEWYRGLVEKAPKHAKAAMYARAKAYLERFLTLHTPKDLNRTRGQVALEKVKEAESELAAAGRPAKPATPAKPAESGIIKPGQWMDLLPLVDPEKDVVKGKWTRRGGGLAVTSRTDGQRTVIPVAVTGSYELEVVLVRTEGKDNVAILIPVGTGKVAVSLNAWYKKARLECVHGKPDNATEVEVGALENGRPYTVRISVLAQGNNARVDVSLNGKQVIQWQGPQSALSPPGAWQLPVRRCLGLGTWGSAVAFRRVRLRMLSGEARLLRPVEK